MQCGSLMIRGFTSLVARRLVFTSTLPRLYSASSYALYMTLQYLILGYCSTTVQTIYSRILCTCRRYLLEGGPKSLRARDEGTRFKLALI